MTPEEFSLAQDRAYRLGKIDGAREEREACASDLEHEASKVWPVGKDVWEPHEAALANKAAILREAAKSIRARKDKKINETFERLEKLLAASEGKG